MSAPATNVPGLPERITTPRGASVSIRPSCSSNHSMMRDDRVLTFFAGSSRTSQAMPAETVRRPGDPVADSFLTGASAALREGLLTGGSSVVGMGIVLSGG